MASGMRALVVDDEAPLRKLTCRALQGVGIACEEAADGVEAGDFLEAQVFDLVVTDLRMPHRHGHALAGLLLAKPQPRPAIVVLTGVVEPLLSTDLRARGVDEIYYKPIDYRQFAERMVQLLAARGPMVLSTDGSSPEPSSLAELAPMTAGMDHEPTERE